LKRSQKQQALVLHGSHVVSQSSLPSVVIMGRPNVGKSSLLNRIIGARIAIVHDQAGITRDTTEHVVQWAGETFRLLDTGGMMFRPEVAELSEAFDRRVAPLVNDQVRAACEAADVVVFLVDGQTGLQEEDVLIRNWLHQLGVYVILAVNKLDNPQQLLQVHDFYAGIVPPPEAYLQAGVKAQETPMPVSALHGTAGVGNLLETIVQTIKECKAAGVIETPEQALTEVLPLETQEAVSQEDTEEDAVTVHSASTSHVPETPLRMTFIGRPNVGKSSMVNALLGAERVIVSEISGTTRDAIDIPFVYEDETFVLVDTAGVRRKGKVDFGVEMFSVDRTIEAARKSDVAVVMFDVSEGLTQQDVRILNKIYDDIARPLVVIANKWDTVTQKTSQTPVAMKKRFIEMLPWLRDVEILFLSAKKPDKLHRILTAVKQARENAHRRLKTNLVNQILQEALALNPPPAQRSKLPRIYYATQVETNPPRFILFVNNPQYIRADYLRYLERTFRERFVLTGTPVVFSMKAKSEKADATGRMPAGRRVSRRHDSE
jgi:GTP-binding protein